MNEILKPTSTYPPYSSMAVVFSNATTAVGERRAYTAIVANNI